MMGHGLHLEWRKPHGDICFDKVHEYFLKNSCDSIFRFLYVLPWGQMSFWGATVITSLASAIPVVGDSIVTWLWGGFSVDNATLNRFFSLHYLLPFLIVGASVLHLAALHQYGSNNPLGTNSTVDKVGLYPYFYVKDLVAWVAFALFFSLFIYFYPNLLGHPDNSIMANALITPKHITPE